MTFEMGLTLAVLIGAVVLFSSGKVCMTTTSMLIMTVLYVSGIVDANGLFSNYISSATLLVIFMFVISGALISSGASGLIGTWMLRGIRSERHALIRVMLISMILSAFFSNMAAAVIVASFAVGMSQSGQRIRLQKLLMGVALGTQLGGMLTIVGVSGNVMVRSILEEAGLGTVGFWDFGKIGLPLCVVGLAYMFLIGYRLAPEAPSREENLPTQNTVSVDRRKCWITISVFSVVVVAMMLENVINIPIHMSAFFGCVILFVTGTITEREAFSYISWPSVAMFASLLTLGTAIAKSGTAGLLANCLVHGLGSGTSTTVIVTVLFVMIAGLTQFMSNGATAAVFYPIGISLAQQLQLNPAAVLMMICIAASSSFATPMATPLNAYLMSVGGYRFSDFVKVGLPLLILTTLVCVVLCPILWPV